jgi:NitT/TauT family transport system substrate-binding protein
MINRRSAIVGGVAAAGAAGILAGFRPAAADGPLETKTIRLIRDRQFPVLCYAPQYVAEQFLELEGFENVEYVSLGDSGSYAEALIDGVADMSAALAVDWVPPIANGAPITVLSGLHAGCVEIFANDTVRTIRDLKGKRVAVHGHSSPERYLLASVAAMIGLDPEVDVEWVLGHPNDWAGMLAGGEADAIASFPPLNYILHDQQIGRVILNTTTDDPWRNYFCCMVAANSDFLARSPNAAKAALRALLMANEMCSSNPEQAAEWLVQEGQSPTLDFAMRTLADLPYDAWRSFDPEDSLRFYALRMREAGLVSASPDRIVADGSDWRIVEALTRELRT